MTHFSSPTFAFAATQGIAAPLVDTLQQGFALEATIAPKVIQQVEQRKYVDAMRTIGGWPHQLRREGIHHTLDNLLPGATVLNLGQGLLNNDTPMSHNLFHFAELLTHTHTHAQPLVDMAERKAEEYLIRGKAVRYVAMNKVAEKLPACPTQGPLRQALADLNDRSVMSSIGGNPNGAQITLLCTTSDKAYIKPQVMLGGPFGDWTPAKGVGYNGFMFRSSPTHTELVERDQEMIAIFRGLAELGEKVGHTPAMAMAVQTSMLEARNTLKQNSHVFAPRAIEQVKQLTRQVARRASVVTPA